MEHQDVDHNRDQLVPCRHCGGKLAVQAYGSHARTCEARRPPLPEGCRVVVWDDKTFSFEGMSEREAVEFIIGPASDFSDPKTRRAARSWARSAILLSPSARRYLPTALAARRNVGSARPQAQQPEQRPRSTRSRRASRARAPDDDGHEPEPQLASCAGCGAPFSPHRPNQSYHSEDCPTLHRKRKYRARLRAASDATLDKAAGHNRETAQRQLAACACCGQRLPREVLDLHTFDCWDREMRANGIVYTPPRPFAGVAA